jgi:RimJ/RimL family protein N-acetyltransferase
MPRGTRTPAGGRPPPPPGPPPAPPLERALARLGEEHREALWAIVSDAVVMRGVGDTRAWSKAKLDRFLRYCADEENEAPARRRFFYWGIFVGGALAGVVGVHPIQYDPRARGWYFLSIFLARGAGNKGTGTWATRAALVLFWALRPDTPVHIDTQADNAAMNALAQKLGFRPTRRPACLQWRCYSRYFLQKGEGWKPADWP